MALFYTYPEPIPSKPASLSDKINEGITTLFGFILYLVFGTVAFILSIPVIFSPFIFLSFLGRLFGIDGSSGSSSGTGGTSGYSGGGYSGGGGSGGGSGGGGSSGGGGGGHGGGGGGG